jgi:hypothetical protein
VLLIVRQAPEYYTASMISQSIVCATFEWIFPASANQRREGLLRTEEAEGRRLIENRTIIRRAAPQGAMSPYRSDP